MGEASKNLRGKDGSCKGKRKNMSAINFFLIRRRRREGGKKERSENQSFIHKRYQGKKEKGGTKPPAIQRRKKNRKQTPTVDEKKERVGVFSGICQAEGNSSKFSSRNKPAKKEKEKNRI